MPNLVDILEAYAASIDMFAPRAWAEKIVDDLKWRYLWIGTMMGSAGASILWLVLTTH